jgi:hypothetical protein
MVRVAGPTTRVGAVLVLAAVLAAGVLLSGCDTNPEDTLHAQEGEAFKLGDLLYNVQITRILNPSDHEDSAYLAGQRPPSKNEYYLGVFMQIHNEGSGSQQVPTEFAVTDTAGTKFRPVRSDSLFALKLGGTVASGDQLPEPDSTAANGPIQGAMVLFRIDGAAIQDRPLTLDIPSSAGAVAEVELDI